MQLFSQRDPRWANTELGWGPPGTTIGGAGCDETCDAMIAWDAYGDMHYTPPALNQVYIADRIYSYDGAGDYDLLTDNALARVWPARFSVETVWGYDAARIAAAVTSPNTYVKFWISTPSVPTHFVISGGGNTIIDPWTGAYGTLSGYGGPAAVKKMIFVTALPDTSAQQAAAAAAAKAAADAAAKAAADAAAAKAAQDALAAQHAADAAKAAAEAQAAADAKAAADAAAAKAAADAQAAADAKAAADAAVAKAAADAAAAKAAADAAASEHTIPLPTAPPSPTAQQAFLWALQTILIAIGRLLLRERR